MDNLYIVMPAYNEEENIKDVVLKWYPLLEEKGKNSKLVIADSGSNDNTNKILKKLKKKYPKLEILSDTGKYHGPKVIALYDYAIKNKADYIFQTDSDDQTNPLEFEKFWNLKNKYDVILGNRVIRGDGKSRALVEKVVCILLKIYFGIEVPDANAPFRLMKSSILKKHLYKLPSDYKLPNIMLTTYFKYYNEKVIFKEISFKPRKAGKNSINLKKIVKIGFESLKDFYIFKQRMKSND